MSTTKDQSNELAYGLIPGQSVKYQARPNGHKAQLTVRGIEPDGSVLCHDSKGAFRALRPERLQVQSTSPRGKIIWVKLLDS